MNKRKFKRIVIKVGTSVLTDERARFSLSLLERIVTQIRHLMAKRHECIIVSSGAIGCGMSVLRMKRRPKELKLLQACAAIGQGKLMKSYEDYFSRYGFHTAQVLITRDAFQDRQRCLNIRNTLQSLLQYRTIPIVNENDTVSTEEIRFGDNDALSIAVAEATEADLLVLLTDVDGVYLNDQKTVMPHVSSVQEIDSLFKHVFSRSKSEMTLGGMSSKLEAAKRAMNAGISTLILNGSKESSVTKFFDGETIGTFFAADGFKRGFKKNWLTTLTESKGYVAVDQGAYQAVLHQGKSLLASGVREVRGTFKAGDSVHVEDMKANVFARGIVNYSSDELRKILGKKTSDIVGVLGYKHSDEVMHRDNLVIVE